MISRSTLLHLRIPFSIFLLPVYLFAVSRAEIPGLWESLLVFFILHLLLYPASNGYNSYFDKDEESIGGLEKPPPVKHELYFVSLLLDLAALLLGFIIGWQFVLMLLVYGLVSKAYSHPAIRLKKYPVPSLLAAAIFQGAFTYMMVLLALDNLKFTELQEPQILFPAFLSTLMLGGFYPLTQVYQHKEDARRGDNTFSLMLGIKGTFYFSAAMFAVSGAAFFVYFFWLDELLNFWLFLLCTSPLTIYFAWWMKKVHKNVAAANYKNTMRMNLLGSLGLNVFFALLIILKLV